MGVGRGKGRGEEWGREEEAAAAAQRSNGIKSNVMFLTKKRVHLSSEGESDKILCVPYDAHQR